MKEKVVFDQTVVGSGWKNAGATRMLEFVVPENEVHIPVDHVVPNSIGIAAVLDVYAESLEIGEKALFD